VAGARTPIGKLLGSLSALSAPELAGGAIAAALERAGITGDQVDAVIMGNVIQAGVGPNPARLAAARGGIPMSVPATTVNKLCLSGLTAIAQAAQQIATGQYEVVVAGGMESMSNAPHLLPGARRGTKYGDAVVLDALDRDGLVCGFDGVSMGAATERYQRGLGISRGGQARRAAARVQHGRDDHGGVRVTAVGRSLRRRRREQGLCGTGAADSPRRHRRLDRRGGAVRRGRAGRRPDRQASSVAAAPSRSVILAGSVMSLA
jgi:acetyl-CoA C-acetyltransferase